ncbi:MAG: carboxypeptidase-like regulatory domain-containing protein, partial [Flavobacteriaceae bacterium]
MQHLKNNFMYGKAIDVDGNPLSNVSLAYGDGQYAFTDSDGYWHIDNLKKGDLLVVSKPNYHFVPKTIEVHSKDVETVFIGHSHSHLSKDDKVFQWVNDRQLDNGLITSNDTSDLVSLYDNALLAIAYVSKKEWAYAERIFDFFESKRSLELEKGDGGFFQFRNREGENGRRTWLGDNAWLLIAIRQYHEATQNQKYAQLQQSLERWIRNQQDSDGGLWGGLNENGQQIHKVTEGIITAFLAIEGYDTFHKDILRYLRAHRWDSHKRTLIAWPENPKYTYALDLHPLGHGILEAYPVTALELAEMYRCTKIATVTGNEMTGYCFDEDKDVIWLEGTAQMAVAYKKSGYPAKSEHRIQEMEKALIEGAMSTNHLGLPYASNPGTSYGPSTLWEEADLVP